MPQRKPLSKVLHELRDPLHTTVCLVQLVKRTCMVEGDKLSEIMPLLENSVHKMKLAVERLAEEARNDPGIQS